MLQRSPRGGLLPKHFRRKSGSYGVRLSNDSSDGTLNFSFSCSYFGSDDSSEAADLVTPTKPQTRAPPRPKSMSPSSDVLCPPRPKSLPPNSLPPAVPHFKSEGHTTNSEPKVDTVAWIRPSLRRTSGLTKKSGTRELFASVPKLNAKGPHSSPVSSPTSPRRPVLKVNHTASEATDSHSPSAFRGSWENTPTVDPKSTFAIFFLVFIRSQYESSFVVWKRISKPSRLYSCIFNQFSYNQLFQFILSLIPV